MITENDFQNLVLPALDDILSNINPPAYKRKEEQSSSIAGMNIKQLARFMKAEKIPSDAEITHSNTDAIVLQWYKDVKTTDKDKEEYIRKTFNCYSYSVVFKVLIKHGYTRVGVPSQNFKQYRDTTEYDMYKGEHDRLKAYYSLFFKK